VTDPVRDPSIVRSLAEGCVEFAESRGCDICVYDGREDFTGAERPIEW
jgi:hypothetical protein